MVEPLALVFVVLMCVELLALFNRLTRDRIKRTGASDDQQRLSSAGF